MNDLTKVSMIDQLKPVYDLSQQFANYFVDFPICVTVSVLIQNLIFSLNNDKDVCEIIKTLRSINKYYSDTHMVKSICDEVLNIFDGLIMAEESINIYED